ncbi:MAG: PAS sensor domain-containing protein [Campylobacteraceae bacterium 4484_4]|nr:MAG: PAS sensor domain-containing protein [Campylobacteraceae bacterium 4484_4]
MAVETESILDRKTVIVSETDEKGVILYANDDFCRISGFSKAELIGKPHNIVRHPDMPKAAFASLWETIKAGNVWNGIVKNRTKEGNYYWVNATVYPSKTPTGEIRYFSVRVKPTDTEIKEAQAAYTLM